MNASVLRWVLLASSGIVVILGVGLAVSVAAGNDDLWQQILGGIVVVGLLEAVLRNRWTTAWLDLEDVERSARRAEAVWRIQRRPQVDRRLLSLSTVFSLIGLAGIGVAIGVSVIDEDATMTLLGSVGRVVGGLGIAASSAAFGALVARNPEREPPATKQPPA